MHLTELKKLTAGNAFILSLGIFLWAVIPPAASKRSVSAGFGHYQYPVAALDLNLTNKRRQDVICTWNNGDWYGQVLFILNGPGQREQSLLLPKLSVREVQLGSVLSSDVTRQLHLTFTAVTNGTQSTVQKFLHPFTEKLGMFRSKAFAIPLDLPPIHGLTEAREIAPCAP